jgi:hypothetical protein
MPDSPKKLSSVENRGVLYRHPKRGVKNPWKRGLPMKGIKDIII